MNTTLIIPDLHHRHQLAEKIIRYVAADSVIFLGDYFDDFHDTPAMAEDTARWLRFSLAHSNRIHLFGNHDLPYAYANRVFLCSGYSTLKDMKIADILNYKHWERVKHYHILDNTFLLTHAGLHANHLPQEITNLYADRPLFFSKISEYLDAEIINGHRQKNWIFSAGRSRGGIQNVGGITWCDFDEEFKPIKGLNSICGHTPNVRVRWANVLENRPGTSYENALEFKPTLEELNNTNNSFNLCLDTNSYHYATWDGTKLQVHWIGDM